MLMGIASWRSPTVERMLNPLLNIAQSLPHFAYMIPVVVFIGVGPKSGAIVTIIFAVPPTRHMDPLESPSVRKVGRPAGKRQAARKSVRFMSYVICHMPSAICHMSYVICHMSVFAVWYNIVWCGAVWCSVVWCGVVWCGVVLLVLRIEIVS